MKFERGFPTTKEQRAAAKRSAAAQNMWDVLKEQTPPEEVKAAFVLVCDFLQVPYVFD